jgi:heat-inducible transcriptional repressor
VSSASQLLSDLTHFAGIVMTPKRANPTLRHIEFLSLGDKRILLIIVASDGDVQNRILQVDHAYTSSELIEAANFLNANFSGCTFDQIRTRLREDLHQLHQDISKLMSAAFEPGNTTAAFSTKDYVISGEHYLLGVQEFSSNMSSLRKLFDLFEQKTSLLRLLDIGSGAHGVQIYIGEESGLVPLDECSVVTAPYEVDGQVVGTVGVVGPTRMAYERVIPIVDITAKLISSVLSHH